MRLIENKDELVNGQRIFYICESTLRRKYGSYIADPIDYWQKVHEGPVRPVSLRFFIDPKNVWASWDNMEDQPNPRSCAHMPIGKVYVDQVDYKADQEADNDEDLL